MKLNVVGTLGTVSYNEATLQSIKLFCFCQLVTTSMTS